MWGSRLQPRSRCRDRLVGFSPGWCHPPQCCGFNRGGVHGRESETPVSCHPAAYGSLPQHATLSCLSLWLGSRAPDCVAPWLGPLSPTPACSHQCVPACPPQHSPHPLLLLTLQPGPPSPAPPGCSSRSHPSLFPVCLHRTELIGGPVNLVPLYQARPTEGRLPWHRRNLN